jgi:hypothetical protein
VTKQLKDIAEKNATEKEKVKHNFQNLWYGLINGLDDLVYFNTKTYSSILVKFKLLQTLQRDLHLYSRNYLGCTGSELVDFYIRNELGKDGQALLPKKITRNDVLEFFRVKRDQEHFSEIFSFSLLQKYQKFFDLTWDTPKSRKTLNKKNISKSISISSLHKSGIAFQNGSSLVLKESTINKIFFFFRHSKSCFKIELGKVLDCYNSSNQDERLILIKKRLVVLKYRAEQEFSKKRQKQKKIEQIALRLKNSHSVQYLSGKMNSFFERGLYDKYRKDFEEELFDAQVQLDQIHSYSQINRVSSKKSHVKKLEESKLDIFDSNMEASLFQNTLRDFKRNWTGKNIQKHEKWRELKSLVTKTVDEAYQSFFNKPNMFLFLKKSSYILFPEIHRRSVFYLECYHKYR